MKRALVILLLVTAAPAAAPGLKEVFDPFWAGWPVEGDRSKLRRGAFERAVAKKGPARAIKAMGKFEAAIDAIQAKLDKDYKRYSKLDAEWWAWRRNYEKTYQKKHGRPPATYPIPQGMNQTYLDQEKLLKTTRALKLKERLFHQWVMTRMAELLAKEPSKKATAALVSGLRTKSLHQRLRCATLLTDAVAIDAALTPGQHPAVLAKLLEKRVAPAMLKHPAWPVRAGAIHGLLKAGDIERLLAMFQPDRLDDDVTDALRRATGQQLGSDPAAWREWWQGARVDWAGSQEEPEIDRSVSPGVFSDGKTTCFGIATNSRAIVYCVEAATEGAWEYLRDEVIRSVGSLPDGARFGIVVYGAKTKRWRKKLATADAGTRADAAAFLRKYKLKGGADMHAGLLEALALAGGKGKAPPSADTIFIGSLYGQKTGLYENPRHVTLEILPVNALRGIRIHAYGPSEGRDAYFLQTLCRQFGGTHKNPQ